MSSPAAFERFLATPQDAPEELCVLTVLNAASSEDVERALTFRDACAQEARFKADALVPVREIGTEDGRPYIVRPYLGAVDASALCGRRAAAPTSVPARIGATVVHGTIQALRVVHEADWAHMCLVGRDVLIDPGGDVSVTGFAEGQFLARYGVRDEEDKSLAPELRRGDADAGPLADCYAVGRLLYQLLTGRDQPDEWEPRWSGIMMELSSAGVPGDALWRTVEFLHRALAERPGQRFASIGKLARAFGPVSVELDAPQPREVVASAIRDILPPIVRIDAGEGASPSHSEALIEDEELPSMTADQDESTTAPEDETRSGSGRRPDEMTRVTGAESGGRANRSTRLVSGSNPSLRSLSPELRERIGPHPLEVLARSRYQVLGELGTGGTGTVYKILDTTLSEVLALKILRQDLTEDTAWLQRFKRELKITRDLEHPHILPAYHLEQLDGLYFFTMRYVDGETLYEAVRQRGALSLEEGLPILIAVGEALGAAHEHGIVHRDFKSGNVIVERVTGHPYLMDFGIALAPDNPGLTITGQGIGTPVYMAPEQAMGDPITSRADIYSFGVVLYQTFSGVLPFEGTTTVAVYTAQVKSQYEPLRSVAPELPEGLGELVDACLAPDPDDRPESVAAIVERLRELLEGR